MTKTRNAFDSEFAFASWRFQAYIERQYREDERRRCRNARSRPYEPPQPPAFDPQHGGVCQIQRAIDDPTSWQPVPGSRVQQALLDLLLVVIVVAVFWLVGK